MNGKHLNPTHTRDCFSKQSTVKPTLKTTWEIGTTWELRTATSVLRPIQYIELDLRNKTTSEFRTVFTVPWVSLIPRLHCTSSFVYTVNRFADYQIMTRMQWPRPNGQLQLGGGAYGEAACGNHGEKFCPGFSETLRPHAPSPSLYDLTASQSPTGKRPLWTSIPCLRPWCYFYGGGGGGLSYTNPAESLPNMDIAWPWLQWGERLITIATQVVLSMFCNNNPPPPNPSPPTAQCNRIYSVISMLPYSEQTSDILHPGPVSPIYKSKS